MLPKMRYRLGLDIGSTSIGWCMIRLNASDDPKAVIRMGVRIFSDGRNPKDGTSLAVTRRQARQMRRRRDRLLKRKERMLSALIRLGFFPQDEKARKQLVDLDPYKLRKKGLYEALSGPEFARALFHINQRRGFLSNRKTDRKDSESGTLKKAITDLRAKLQQESCQTLGEWLASRHEKRLSVRARLRGKTQKDKAYDFYADRAMVEHEFDALWSKQSSLNPQLFTEVARQELKDILLYQRPLKPVKPGRCTLMPEEKRAPLALPSTQQFRIYQEVNNLRLLNDDLTEKPPLTLQQRNQVVHLLEKGNATFDQIRKVLQLSGTTKFNIEDIKRKELKGNITSSILSKKGNFGKHWHEFDFRCQDIIVRKLLRTSNESALIKWLQKYTGIDEAAAERIANTGLPEGYGSLSRKALSYILPELVRDVVTYSESVTRAGLKSHSALSHAEKTGEIFDALPYYGQSLQRHVGFGTGNPDDPLEKRYGKIANPTVHIGLNELRKIVNALINRYGHPSQVVIEVARELKQGKQLRDKITKEQAKNQKRNREWLENACRELGRDPDTLDVGARRNITQKMQLWHELNPESNLDRCCPYTGERISIARLLSDEVEIDHILPYSKTLDDSLNNKTVAMRRANRDKGNRTPYDAFGAQPMLEYDYAAILERAKLMSKAKSKRFAPDGYMQWLSGEKDFLARALNDTAYLSRIAKEYLSLVCPGNHVWVIPGRMTALLRNNFGLNHLLSGSKEKTRNDHRHHALDAVVIAVTDRRLLRRFAEASASAREKQLNRLVEGMSLPWDTYHKHVERALGHIVVSFRPDHSYEGVMHDATSYRPPHLDSKNEWRTHGIGGNKPDARRADSNAMIAINSYRDSGRHKVDEHGNPKPYKGYVSSNNYCVEIWRDDRGKWKGNVISRFQAYQLVRQLGDVEGVKRLRHPELSQAGKPLVMRLMIDDLVRFGTIDGTKIMRVVKISGTGQIFFAEHNEANVDARDRDKGDPFKYTSKYAGSLQKAQGRRVTVSEIGELSDPGFRD